MSVDYIAGMHEKPSQTRLLNAAVVVAALGYFVDIYDLILFAVVRVPSLKSLGLNDAEILTKGVFLLNTQMVGMLLGGLLWGILGDRKGRLSVLFGSILTYSIANGANAFVHSVEAYAFWRFVAGVGLAGELGAGVTLVAEILPKEKRGWGTALVASVGVLGALLAGTVAKFLDWRTAYMVGAALGLSLLVLRISVVESGMFEQMRSGAAPRGDFLSLLKTWKSASKYLSCILIGVPIWFVVGILVTFSPEFGRSIGMPEIPAAGTAVMFCYAGLALGDFGSGALSQWLRSRRKVVGIFLTALALLSAFYLIGLPLTLPAFYGLCFALGLAGGYWAVFVTIAAEQFGTNQRATAATTVPNFVRGAVALITTSFLWLKPSLGLRPAAAVVGTVTLVLALLALLRLPETFAKDLDYLEK
ncbi:MAG: putative niacin/nicotinamide transporter NaiP [Fibrobacterota bacterium]|jgi:MFS family permease